MKKFLCSSENSIKYVTIQNITSLLKITLPLKILTLPLKKPKIILKNVEIQKIGDILKLWLLFEFCLQKIIRKRKQNIRQWQIFAERNIQFSGKRKKKSSFKISSTLILYLIVKFISLKEKFTSINTIHSSI